MYCRVGVRQNGNVCCSVIWNFNTRISVCICFYEKTWASTCSQCRRSFSAQCDNERKIYKIMRDPYALCITMNPNGKLVAKFALQTRLSHYTLFLSGIKGQQSACLRLVLLTISYGLHHWRISKYFFSFPNEKEIMQIWWIDFFLVVSSHTDAAPNRITNDFLPTNWIWNISYSLKMA